MDFKNFLIVALMLMLCLNVFAAAPVITAVTASPISVTDHNYSNWKSPNYMTLRAAVTGADLNKDGCGYAIDGSWSYPTGTDLNLDTNVYTIIVQALAEDDTNWGISCTNTAGETGYFFRTIYLDANAPLSGSSFDGTSTLTLTTSDYATNTGNGSGIQDLYYRINSGTWTSAGAVTQTDLVLTPGNYTIDFYAIDNLDNNEWATEGDYWTTTFYVGAVTNSACGLINLIPIILAAILLIGILMALKLGVQITPEIVTALVIAAVVGVIAIIVYSQVVVGFCAV